MKQYSEIDRAAVRKLRDRELTYGQISVYLKIPRSTVWDIINRPPTGHKGRVRNRKSF